MSARGDLAKRTPLLAEQERIRLTAPAREMIEARYQMKCECQGASPYADQHEAPELGLCPRFECARCHGSTPWCCGGSDAYICNECWCVVTRRGERNIPHRWDIANAEHYGDAAR